MSKTVTIRAADSAMAMEEVVRQLGPDAMILSTKRRNGQFEIEAMVEEEAEAPAKPALAERLSKAAFQKPTTDPESDVGKTSPATFEALLKRRLEQESAVSIDAGTEERLEQSAAEHQPAIEEAVPDAEFEAVETPQAQTPPDHVEPAPEEQPELRHAPLFDHKPSKPVLTEAAKNAPLAERASEKEAKAPLFERYKPGKPQLVASNDTPVKPRKSPFQGLGIMEIPTPGLPDHLVDTFRTDLEHYDATGELAGLTRAIVSTLIPQQITESLGTGRFWLAGPDMRQKALTAMRIAVRKLEAGEEKPTFYVMGNEARADAAYLSSKADLLGLQVSLIDESVGRNLPDNAAGAQIILLPDSAEKSKAYADRFREDGDKGLMVLPTHFGRMALEPTLREWSGMDVQILLTISENADVPAELVACLLQFNWQVGWSSDGEDILDNLIQSNDETVTGWMRSWVPEKEDDAVSSAPFGTARAVAGL